MCTLTSGSLRSLKKAEVVATLTWLIGVWVLCHYSQTSGTHYILLLDKATATEVINHLLMVIFFLSFLISFSTRKGLFLLKARAWALDESIWNQYDILLMGHCHVFCFHYTVLDWGSHSVNPREREPSEKNCRGAAFDWVCTGLALEHPQPHEN